MSDLPEGFARVRLAIGKSRLEIEASENIASTMLDMFMRMHGYGVNEDGDYIPPEKDGKDE